MAEGRAALADEETPLPRSADRPARVLLVDDEKVVRRAVGMALRELGHTVTLCEDGAVAVDEYARCWRDIDVVVLDMVMPNLTGKQTFLELRRINPAAKVILASGYSIDQEAQESLDAGAVAFVEKPFKVAALSRRISEVAAR
jgi:CheY-like chemotaxis protein